MLAIGRDIRYRITPILEAHWEEFFCSYRRWIRPVVLDTVRKLRACRTPALGCHVFACPSGHQIKVVPHSCESRFRPTCGKHATDQWADQVLNDLLDVPFHHLVLSVPWQLRLLALLNRAVVLSLLARAATACFTQWARDHLISSGRGVGHQGSRALPRGMRSDGRIRWGWSRFRDF